MTNKERIKHPCPNCHAKAGEPCRHYNGEETDRPHKTRGPGELERHLAAEAERTTTRQRKPYGTLFASMAAEEVPLPTVEDMKRKKQLDAAKGVETGLLISQPNRGLEWLRLFAIYNAAVEVVGEEWAGAMWDHCRRVYDTKETYIADALRSCLTTTTRTVLKYERRFDAAKINPPYNDGFYVHDAIVWEPSAPVLTSAEFAGRFPQLDHWHGAKDAPEHDDGGLFERLFGRNRPQPTEQAR